MAGVIGGDAVLLYGLDSNGNPVPLLLGADGTLQGASGVELGSTPSTQAIGDAAAGGSATTASKNDHKHGLPAFGASAAAIGTSAAGAAATPSRSDHVHAIPDQLVASRMIAADSTQATVATSQTTTSTSYTDLATAGPQVTITSGVTQVHISVVSAFLTNSAGTNATIMAPSIGGNEAVDGVGCIDCRAVTIIRASALTRTSGVTSPCVHKARYKVGGGTGTWVNRDILAWAM
jgi:hypothetical protein